MYGMQDKDPQNTYPAARMFGALWITRGLFFTAPIISYIVCILKHNIVEFNSTTRGQQKQIGCNKSEIIRKEKQAK